MVNNILQKGLISSVSLLIGRLWNLSQSHILRPHKIQKEIDAVLFGRLDEEQQSKNAIINKTYFDNQILPY